MGRIALPITSVLAVLALGAGGCQVDRVIEVEVMRNEEGLILNGPFGPDDMRVHPLTHAEIVDGRPRLVVHMEINDAWGDSVKGLGTVGIELSRIGAGVGEDQTRWDIDIGGVERNVSYFDGVTRTYRFVLTGVPSWFGREGRGRLTLTFNWARADGSVDSRSDSYEILESDPAG